MMSDVDLRRTMNRLVGKSLIFAAALALLPTAAVAATPSDDLPEPPIIEAPDPASPTDIEKYLTLPAISIEQADWMTKVQEVLGSDPNFNSIAIAEDRESMTVTWHGVPSDGLNELLSVAPADTRVTVAASKFPGGKLRELVLRAVERGQFNGSRVVSGFANLDGSGITLDVLSEGDTRRKAQADIAEELGSGAVPVAVNTARGPVQPFYSRYDDPYHLGGGFIVNGNTGGGCTAGFAVQRNGTSQKGMMLASHCGSVGNNWARPSPSAPYGYYSYGTAVQEIDAYDGAIIEAANNHFQPYVWTTTWDGSDGYLPVRGTISPAAGTELCYSGAYTGLNCGNIVNNPAATWSLSGVGAITGILTVKNGGGTAAGQGDSGGPGVVVVMNSSGFSFLAAGIISGGPPSPPSSTCAGRPATRVCGPSVYAGRVNDIAGAAGVTVQVAP